jgi:FtsH-binding integral membrane protein
MNPAEFQANTPYAAFGTMVSDAPVDARRTFIRKTYTHLAAAVYAFVALEWIFFSLGWHEPFMEMLAGHPMYWLGVLGAFIAVNWIADSWARSATSIGMQYAGLFLAVAAWSVIFIPMLAIAQLFTLNVEGLRGVPVIPAAAVTTLVMFGGLTAFAFTTKKDFSFLSGFLSLAMFAAVAAILLSFFVGLQLGVWFSAAMIVVACGYVLYDTSNVIHHYRTDQYVAASVALFASVALLFWYVLRIMLAFSSRR